MHSDDMCIFSRLPFADTDVENTIALLHEKFFFRPGLSEFSASFSRELSCYIAVHLQLEWTAGSVHVHFLASKNMLWIGRSLKTMPSMFLVGFKTFRG